MEAIIGIMLVSIVNQTTIKTEDPMERVQVAFPTIDFDDHCWILYPQPTTKRRIVNGMAETEGN